MRSEIPLVVLSPTGAPVAGASVQINVRGGGSATVFQFETGPQVVANPVVTDDYGRASGWLDRGAYDAVITAAGLQPYTEQFESVPARDGAIDTAWLADAAVTAAKLAPGSAAGALGANSITTAQLQNLAVTSAKIGLGAVIAANLGPIPIRFVTADYTLALDDRWGLVIVDSATPHTVTIPNTSSVNIEIGIPVTIVQFNTGQVTIAPASGVTLRYTPGTKLAGRYAMSQVIPVAANDWLLAGNLVS